MRSHISKYRTLVFDCDGVVLNSNSIKTEAFYEAALPYGVLAAKRLVKYHVENGGVSRYRKFDYFLRNLIEPSQPGPCIDRLLADYSARVRQGLLSCEIANGLVDLRRCTAGAKWLIVSGGDQDELRELFKVRGISNLFNGGIFGSPDNKEKILQREIDIGNIIFPALFLGDSKYDYHAALSFNIDFLFLSSWSELVNKQQWIKEHGISAAENIESIFHF